MGGFLKWWYQTAIGFPTKNDHFGVFWGYHHFRKHPYVQQNIVPSLKLTVRTWKDSIPKQETHLPTHQCFRCENVSFREGNYLGPCPKALLLRVESVKVYIDFIGDEKWMDYIYIDIPGFLQGPKYIILLNLIMTGVFIMADEITPIELGRNSSPNLT